MGKEHWRNIADRTEDDKSTIDDMEILTLVLNVFCLKNIFGEDISGYLGINKNDID